MTTVIPIKPMAWSYSSLQSFNTCPRRYKLTKVTKEIKEPQTEATIHGNDVHKALELHVKGEQPLPKKYGDYLPIVNKVKQTEGKKLVEFKFGLTEAFKPTEFFGKDVWCRGVLDLAIVKPTSAVVLDWKTGKVKPDNDQLKLFAAATFANFPYVEKVRTGFVWLAYNKLDSEEFSRGDVPAIWQHFLPQIQRLRHAESNDDFPPRPSGLCRAWCPVPRAKCEFSGKV